MIRFLGKVLFLFVFLIQLSFMLASTAKADNEVPSADTKKQINELGAKIISPDSNGHFNIDSIVELGRLGYSDAISFLVQSFKEQKKIFEAKMKD